MNVSTKKILLAIGLGLVVAPAMAQLPHGWHLMDKETESYYGISLKKAYQFVQDKKQKSNTVIVAIIDSGVDTLHEDLKPILWINKKEIPGNGIDDDGNGYIDDIYGWNFLGSKDGKNVDKDSFEADRMYLADKTRFEKIDPKNLSAADRKIYNEWLRAKDQDKNGPAVQQVRMILNDVKKSDVMLKKELGKEKFTMKDLTALPKTNKNAAILLTYMKSMVGTKENPDFTNEELIAQMDKRFDYFVTESAKARLSGPDPATFRANIVKDNYNDINDRYYGNGDVMTSLTGAMHGTHVAGIIGAVRNNGLGMDGVADNVQIMMIRAVPDGDEHDKDIALAIRYAVDNGARIINMSFGKAFSPQKIWVDDAVKYAESKNVLLVHAAGNNGENTDQFDNYPTPVFENHKKAGNWISVGASSDPTTSDKSSMASFSNYGKKTVDVFAPGVQIYSSVPGGNVYKNLDGTSMATPVVSGLAAFLLEYYPNLTAKQLKQVIEKSAINPHVKAKKPHTDEYVDLADLSMTGGLVNAYEAVKMADTMKGAAKKSNSK